MSEMGTPERKKLRKSDILLNDGTDNLQRTGEECLAAYHMCQTQLNLLDEELTQEKQATARKYDSLKTPLYDRRAELTRTLTDFWVACLENHPQLSHLIENDEVQVVLQYMVKIEAEDNAEDSTGSNCKLHFYFDENPYIENSLLTKEVTLSGNNSSIRSSSTRIRWKKVMGFLQRIDDTSSPPESKKRKHRRHRNFFEWFSDDENFDEDVFSYLEAINNNPLPYSPFFFTEIENYPEMDVLEDELVDDEVVDVAEVLQDVVDDEDVVEVENVVVVEGDVHEHPDIAGRSNVMVVQADVHEPPERAGKKGNTKPTLRKKVAKSLSNIDLDKIEKMDVIDENEIFTRTQEDKDFDFYK